MITKLTWLSDSERAQGCDGVQCALRRHGAGLVVLVQGLPRLAVVGTDLASRGVPYLDDQELVGSAGVRTEAKAQIARALLEAVGWSPGLFERRPGPISVPSSTPAKACPGWSA
jgi:hypothetical protein